MTRLAILSDLHLEFDRAHAAEGGRLDKSPARETLEAAGHPEHGPDLGGLAGACDAVILAGDIDTGSQAFEYAVQVRAWLGVPVILVAGNHEFYGYDQGETVTGFRHHAEHCDGVSFLENDGMVIDGAVPVRILGCTLWTDFALFGAERREEALAHARISMTDFTGTVGFGHDIFLPEDAARLHAESRQWLERQLAEPFPGATVVATHHAPSFRSVPPRFREDLLSAAYASNLDSLVERSGAALWVHGHMHDSADYHVAGTRVLCNPRGYTPSALNGAFDPAQVVSIDG